MNKLVIALALVATTAAAIPAHAQTMRAQSSIQAAGNQCFKATDSGRGFGYWTKCEDVYAFAIRNRALTVNPEVLSQIQNGGGTEGGGGGDGGGGGGGGGR